MTTEFDEIRPEDDGNRLPSFRHMDAKSVAHYLGLTSIDNLGGMEPQGSAETTLLSLVKAQYKQKKQCVDIKTLFSMGSALRNYAYLTRDLGKELSNKKEWQSRCLHEMAELIVYGVTDRYFSEENAKFLCIRIEFIFCLVEGYKKPITGTRLEEQIKRWRL